jgi:hypothetical protein
MWWRRLRYVLLLAGLCAIATCPGAKRACTAKQHAREADELTEYLADRIEAAIHATGHVPPAAAAPTPLPACCEREDGVCAPDPSVWTTPAWQALAFSIDGDHRYTYTYVPADDGRSAVVRAVGDTDCDGESSLYELEVRVDGDGVHRTATRKNPYE